MKPWLTPWQVLIVLVVWVVPVMAGYFLGKRKGRTAIGVSLTVILNVLGLMILALYPRRGTAQMPAASDPVPPPLSAVGSIQPEWDEKKAQTDSWIWRLSRTRPATGTRHARVRGLRRDPAPLAHF